MTPRESKIKSSPAATLLRISILNEPCVQGKQVEFDVTTEGSKPESLIFEVTNDKNTWKWKQDVKLAGTKTKWPIDPNSADLKQLGITIIKSYDYDPKNHPSSDTYKVTVSAEPKKSYKDGNYSFFVEENFSRKFSELADMGKDDIVRIRKFFSTLLEGQDSDEAANKLKMALSDLPKAVVTKIKELPEWNTIKDKINDWDEIKTAIKSIPERLPEPGKSTPVSLQRATAKPTEDLVLWGIIKHQKDIFKRINEGVAARLSVDEDETFRDVDAYNNLKHYVDEEMKKHFKTTWDVDAIWNNITTETENFSKELTKDKIKEFFNDFYPRDEHGEIDYSTWKKGDPTFPYFDQVKESSCMPDPSRSPKERENDGQYILDRLNDSKFDKVKHEKLILMQERLNAHHNPQDLGFFYDRIKECAKELNHYEPELYNDLMKRLRGKCILFNRITQPMLIELIWSYWMEESMLAQGMKTISNRFQNIKSAAGVDPLMNLNTNPLRRLGNLIWGYIQDEPNRLSVRRRAYEYDHHYGITLHGKAVQQISPADSRTTFIEAFHRLLYLCSIYFKELDDTTIYADAFPVKNALRDVHVILAEGAHNQYGDLVWVARREMYIEQFILSRPEMREFLTGRPMVPYRESWMQPLETLKNLMGWTNSSVEHFSTLANTGEQVLLSIRFGGWNSPNITSANAANWAAYWRDEIQDYLHSYRAVTGADLTDPRQIDGTQPSVHLLRRLNEQHRKAG